MKIRPLQDRLIVKRVAEENKTKGGIIIPDNAKEKPSEGEVISVGEGAYNEDGDRIKPDVKAEDDLETKRDEALPTALDELAQELQ